jgi:hypothetical protein
MYSKLFSKLSFSTKRSSCGQFAQKELLALVLQAGKWFYVPSLFFVNHYD